MKPLQVKLITIAEGKDKGKKGYGITDGKKWHIYAFATKEAADRVATSIGDEEISHRVNVGYPQNHVMFKDL